MVVLDEWQVVLSAPAENVRLASIRSGCTLVLEER
jgi:hypothetical protein